MHTCTSSLLQRVLKGGSISFGVTALFMVLAEVYCAVAGDVICNVLVCHGAVHFISINPKSHLSLFCVSISCVPVVFWLYRNLLQVILPARCNVFLMAGVATGEIKCMPLAL